MIAEDGDLLVSLQLSVVVFDVVVVDVVVVGVGGLLVSLQLSVVVFDVVVVVVVDDGGLLVPLLLVACMV